MSTGETKRRVITGQPVFGCWLEMCSPIAAEIIAQAGYDVVLIDLEHGPASILDAVSLMHAVQGRACAPLIRVPSNDPAILKRVLDIGVVGVMIPAVDTAAEATAAVSACRYPPNGIRGMAASIVRASDYGANSRDYIAAADESLLIMCQIESAEAVENVAEIAAVEGVDVLFIGPSDLSASLGYPGEPDHPEVRKKMAQVEEAAKHAGCALGCVPTPGRSAEDLLAAGYRLILTDADVGLLGGAARARVKALRAAAKMKAV